MRGQPQASPAESTAPGGPRRAAGTPPGPGEARRHLVARPLPDPVAIRLCQVPETAPLYDDEAPGETGPGQADILAAAIVAARARNGRPGREAEARAAGVSCSGRGEPQPPGPARKLGTAGPAQPASATRTAGTTPTAATGDTAGPAQARAAGSAGAVRHAPAASPAPGPWPGKFAQVLAETLAGSRPPAQIAPWTTERARSHIRNLGPLLEAGQRPLVQRIITSLPSADVMEMSVVVGFGPRVRALAVRLERTPGRPAAAGQAARPSRWLCTVVEAA